MKKQSAYINREISWLDFNKRVLEEADDKNNPLLERLKFMSIFRSNLDEFFMVRVGGLMDQCMAGFKGEDNITCLPPEKQIDMILDKTESLMNMYESIEKPLFAEAARIGVKYIAPEKVSESEKQAIHDVFLKNALPLVSTIIVDAKHPFPYLPNKSVFIAVRIKGKSREKTGLVLFPESAERLVLLDTADISFFLVEDAAREFANMFFPGQEILETGKFRVTRNADMVMDDADLADVEDFSIAMRNILEIRKRLMPVRLETDLLRSSRLAGEISARFNLSAKQVFTLSGPLDLRFFGKVADTAKLKGYAKYFYPEIKSVYVPGLAPRASVIRQVKIKDQLMLHPYVNFEAVLALLREAAYDESVIAIRQTLYRVSSNSEVVKYLMQAAENGKDVTVLVELKARFDEANNINWAAKLEGSGCRVIYGKDNVKVHSKLLLITRKSSKGLSFTAHISTGNYNEETANLYTDIGLLTSNEDIANDIILFFRELGAGKADETYRVLSVSPEGMRKKIYSLIDAEIRNCLNGKPAHIIIKINALADRGVADRLIDASKAGVKVDLLIRGICCLKAGIPKITENIRVISVIGRFLEHSRIYWFLNGGDEKLFISSADLMTRNLNRRMEVLCPVLDRSIAQNIKCLMLTLMKDTAKGRIMRPDGSYKRLDMEDGVPDAQIVQYRLCREEYEQKVPKARRTRPRTLRRALSSALISIGKRISPRSE